MKAAFHTLGCKVNQNETAALEELFRRGGFEVVDAEAAADVYVVNSCTVTAEGTAKSRRYLRRMKRQNPACVTVLTGCFPQAFPGEAAAYSEADVVTGTANRARLLDALRAFLATGAQVVDIIPHECGEGFEELPAAKSAVRTRAFIKVQDGCNRRCAYCIIPTARGPSRSRSEAEILREVEAQAALGCAEVVLTGINLPSYGRDTGTSLGFLVQSIAKIDAVRSIRLSSLDPDLVTPEEITRFAGVEKLCPHFHLSLQSGCDATLRRMRRPYTAQGYRVAAQALRAAFPGATVTTDAIVGFPGETEEEFAQSLDFVREMRFLKVHVFPFSSRAGTAAAEFSGQLTRQEKTSRAKAMQRAADEVRADVIAEMAGTVQEVLLEQPGPNGLFTGYTRSYVPVELEAPGFRTGDTLRVKLGAFNGERCGCELV